MGLPDPDSAKTWGGKLLVDRDGTAIGTCTEIFVDDATGLPEWAAADVGGGPAFIPLIDAEESGDQVRVAIRQADVAAAPPMEDAGHISQDAEERLYRHYGIEVSRDASETLLPVEATEPTASTSSPSPVTDVTEVADALDEKGGRLLPALGAGTVGVLAAIAAAVFWWRRRLQAPPTRKELLAARARTASLAMASSRERLTTAAAPLLQSGRRLSATAFQRAAVQARVAAERAAVQARAAAQRAAVIAADARTVRLQRLSPGADVEPQPVVLATATRLRRTRVVGALETAAGFATGYAVAARRAGRPDELEQSTGGQRRQLRQMAGQVRARATDAVQAGNAQLSRRASGLADGVRRRSAGSGDTASASDASGTRA